MSNDRPEQIRRELEERFKPEELLVKDQSQLHAGHEGAKDGKGHFDVTIISTAFEGQTASSATEWFMMHLLNYFKPIFTRSGLKLSPRQSALQQTKNLLFHTKSKDF